MRATTMGKWSRKCARVCICSSGNPASPISWPRTSAPSPRSTPPLRAGSASAPTTWPQPISCPRGILTMLCGSRWTPALSRWPPSRWRPSTAPRLTGLTIWSVRFARGVSRISCSWTTCGRSASSGSWPAAAWQPKTGSFPIGSTRRSAAACSRVRSSARWPRRTISPTMSPCRTGQPMCLRWMSRGRLSASAGTWRSRSKTARCSPTRSRMSR